MPEHLKALVVLLALAVVVYFFLKAPVCALGVTGADFNRRRNLWFGITLAAFLSHNFWVFVVVASAILIFALPRESNRLALMFSLLFAVPMFSQEVSGFGLITHFFALDYGRLLALAVLLPTFFGVIAQSDNERFGRNLPDKLLAGYMVLQLVLMLKASTFTNSLRVGVFYQFIDVFLPYYVASRTLKTLADFHHAAIAFVAAALLLAAIGFFEFARSWLLYSSLQAAIGVDWGLLGKYLNRGDSGILRAMASTGHSIALGYVMATAIGLFLCIKKPVAKTLPWYFGLSGLVLGLIFPLARGPWIGATALLFVYVFAGPNPGKIFLKVGLIGLVVAPLLLLSPFGGKIISYLPFVGDIDEHSISYRTSLLDISIQVILQNPYFGAFNYIYSPEMQALKQGQGIIDIVNTYLGIALASGLVGLSLFSGFFITVVIGIAGSMRRIRDKEDDSHILGRSLLATLIGILVIIFTVSNISVVPMIYWSIAGVGVAFKRFIAVAPAYSSLPKTELGKTHLSSPRTSWINMAPRG